MPTTRTWFGGTGQFNNANNWDPAGVPVSGDTAILDTGTVQLSNQGLSGVTFDMTGTSAATQPVLTLRNVALNGTIESTGNGSFMTGSFGEVDARGVVTSAGLISVLGGRAPEGHLTIDIHSGSSFVNAGTITDFDPTPDNLLVNGGGTFVNDGTVLSQDGSPIFDTKVIGTGTFNVRSADLFGASLEFDKSVSSGITVSFNDTVSFVGIILTEPLQFMAAIIDMGKMVNNGTPVESIDLPNQPASKVTSETFADNQLQLFAGHKLVADLNIVGDFTTANFALSADDNGGTFIFFTKTPAMATPDPPIVPSMAHS
jgi:hypothetical protein